MVVKTRKQGNSITITIPSEFNIPSGVKYEAKLLPSGEIIFTPKSLGIRFLMYLMMPLT